MKRPWVVSHAQLTRPEERPHDEREPLPDEEVHVTLPSHPYGVLFELQRRGDRARVTGITVRRLRGDDRDVSARDVRRLPLTRARDAALAMAERVAAGTTTGRPDELDRILVPRGGPRSVPPAKFYKELADMHRAIAAEGGKSPPKEIARRKRVPVNRVYQWIHRARELGYLEPPPGRTGS